MALSEAQENALAFLRYKGGSCLITEVADKNERGVFGEKIPGMRVFKSLEKLGLLIITEEEPFTGCAEDDPMYGFEFTPMIELCNSGHDTQVEV